MPPAQRPPSRTTRPGPPGPFPRPPRRPSIISATSPRSSQRAATDATGRRSSRAAWRCTSRTARWPAATAGRRSSRQERREPADPVRRRAGRGLPDAARGRRQAAVFRADRRAPRWIDQGAKWTGTGLAKNAKPAADHWSFRPPRRVTPPVVKNPRWIRNPIDAFVLGRLEREGMSPSPEADRAALIRRVSLDLTGLPPTPAEVDAFLGDDRPDAYERLVDRLLATPALRRALGPALARPGPLRRHQRLREGPRPLDLALSRLGHPRPQRRHAVRPVHHRADRRRPAAGRRRSARRSPPGSIATR